MIKIKIYKYTEIDAWTDRIEICTNIEKLFIILRIEKMKKKNSRMKRNERKTNQRDIFNIRFDTNIQKKTTKHCPLSYYYI